jgi:hypothetical protein
MGLQRHSVGIEINYAFFEYMQEKLNIGKTNCRYEGLPESQYEIFDTETGENKAYPFSP